MSESDDSYTTPKGLTFSIYHNLNKAGGDNDRGVATSLIRCLDQCSERPGFLCRGVAFDSVRNLCYFKNSTVTPDNGRHETGVILGIANQTQLQALSPACVNGGKTQATQNGLNFTIYCDQNMSGGDLCGDLSPGCRTHTETLEECLKFCSTRHPLCTGVSWDSTLRAGFQNCYPKNATAKDFDKGLSSSVNHLTSAKVALQALPDDCSRSGATVSAKNQEAFILACNEDRPGNDMAVLHKVSKDACIDSCTGNCVGVVFDANMEGGFENCYLKSAIGEPVANQTGLRPSRQIGLTFALRQNGTSNSNLNVSFPPSKNNSTLNVSSPPPKNNSSQTPLVGLIIGPIAALAVICAILFWWWRVRRRRRKEEAKRNNTPQGEILKSELSADSLAVPKYELDDLPNRWELEGNAGR